MQISYWGSLENKYRCYLLAEPTITKTQLRNTPCHVFHLQQKHPSPDNRKHQVLTAWGLGWWIFFFFIKLRLLHVTRFIYSRKPDPLKKEKKEHSVYRVSMIKHEQVKLVSFSSTVQLAVMATKSLVACPIQRPVLLKLWVLSSRLYCVYAIAQKPNPSSCSTHCQQHMM